MLFIPLSLNDSQKVKKKKNTQETLKKPPPTLKLLLPLPPADPLHKQSYERNKESFKK